MRSRTELLDLLQWISDELSDAVQADGEQGASWLNEKFAKEFARQHPHLTRALGTIQSRISDALDGEE